MLDVALPRPRDRVAMADDADYNRYRQAVLRFLYEKQRKVETLPSRRKTGPDDEKPRLRAKA